MGDNKKDRLFRGVPVMTFTEFGDANGISGATASRHFKNNKDLFTDGVDYFKVTREHLAGKPYTFRYTNKARYGSLAIRTSPDELQIPIDAGPTENIYSVSGYSTYITRSGSVILLKILRERESKSCYKLHKKTDRDTVIEPTISVINELVNHAIYNRVTNMLKYNRPMPSINEQGKLVYENCDKDMADLYDTMATDIRSKVSSVYGVPNSHNIIQILKFIQIS